MVLKQLDIHMGKKRNLNTDFIPSGKLIQIGLYYLNIKHKTKKLSENHLGENLDDIRNDDDFLRYNKNIIYERNML